MRIRDCGRCLFICRQKNRNDLSSLCLAVFFVFSLIVIFQHALNVLRWWYQYLQFSTVRHEGNDNDASAVFLDRRPCFFYLLGMFFQKLGGGFLRPHFSMFSASLRGVEKIELSYCSSVIHHVRMSPTHPAPPRARGVRFRPHPQNATFHNASTLVRKALAWEQVRRFWKEAGII